MHTQKPTWKCLAALVGIALIGGWPPEALGQAETEEEKAEKEVRLEPLKSAPLKARSQERMEIKPEFPEDKVWVVAESPPELIGGLSGLVKELQYPESARMNGIQGVVMLSFIVNKQGFVEQAVVEQGIGGGCDEETLRVIRQARFKPGMQVELTPDGNLYRKPVRVPMTLPFTFNLRTSGFVVPFDARIR